MTSFSDYVKNNPVATQGAKPGLLGRIGNGIKSYASGIGNTVSSNFNEAKNAIENANDNPLSKNSSLGNGLATGATVFKDMAGSLTSPITQAIKPISDATGVTSGLNNIGQGFVNSPVGQKVTDVLSKYPTASGAASDTIQGALDIGMVEGGVSGLKSATDTVGNIWDKVHNSDAPSSYQAKLDAATQANNQAGANALSAGNELTGTFSDIKSDAGTQFNQAANDIATTNPTAQAIIPTELIGKMNEVKGGSGFELPDKVSMSSPQFGGNIKIGDIEQGGVGHSPAEMQDLISKFNDVAFKAKASGELKINQQAATVARELHDISSKAFGNVTDAQGNSVWDNAYQNYRQVSDLTDKMSSLFNMNRTPGEISDPMELNKMIGNVMKLGETPQGKAILQQSATQIKNATGYDITDSIGTINKLSESNADLATALRGGYGHQFVEGLKNPRMLSRRAMFAATTILGVTAAATAFRKSIGNFIAGQ